jgi:hypothetical protein
MAALWVCSMADKTAGKKDGKMAGWKVSNWAVEMADLMVGWSVWKRAGRLVWWRVGRWGDLRAVDWAELTADY